jgi:hypothetical protein
MVQAQKYTISGSIKDAASGESLIGAYVYNIRSHHGTTANNYGFYSITLPQDSVHLIISYVGYEKQIASFLLSKDTTINFALASGNTLEEVVVSGTVEDQIQETTRMGTIDVPVEQIKAMPALLGEVDVLKVLQLLPGVQSGATGHPNSRAATSTVSFLRPPWAGVYRKNRSWCHRNLSAISS